jgi:DNA-binding CsgD family transcriptional regulator
MLAWSALEARDLPGGADYAARAVAYSARHEIPANEGPARAQQARFLELAGSWDQAAEIARELAERAAIVQMVALPILGVLEARRGRPSAASILDRSWARAKAADEFQRLSASATANAEYAWINDLAINDLDRALATMESGLQRRMAWPTGLLAFWLWKAGAIPAIPAGVAEPYRLVAAGQATDAAAILESLGLPYEQAHMLSHGDREERLRALEMMETLGAVAVAARLRRSLRQEGINAPRGRGRETRRNTAGLTGRQAEVLALLDTGLSNLEIADRLFVSPRTVENHVAAILDKLDADTRESAVARAHDAGLLVGTA